MMGKPSDLAAWSRTVDTRCTKASTHRAACMAAASIERAQHTCVCRRSLFLFPLESSKAVANLQLGKLKLWQACFGPTGERGGVASRGWQLYMQ